jgi:hypothetical protein
MSLSTALALPLASTAGAQFVPATWHENGHTIGPDPTLFSYYAHGRLTFEPEYFSPLGFEWGERTTCSIVLHGNLWNEGGNAHAQTTAGTASSCSGKPVELTGFPWTAQSQYNRRLDHAVARFTYNGQTYNDNVGPHGVNPILFAAEGTTPGELAFMGSFEPGHSHETLSGNQLVDINNVQGLFESAIYGLLRFEDANRAALGEGAAVVLE